MSYLYFMINKKAIFIVLLFITLSLSMRSKRREVEDKLDGSKKSQNNQKSTNFQATHHITKGSDRNKNNQKIAKEDKNLVHPSKTQQNTQSLNSLSKIQNQPQQVDLEKQHKQHKGNTLKLEKTNNEKQIDKKTPKQSDQKTSQLNKHKTSSPKDTSVKQKNKKLHQKEQKKKAAEQNTEVQEHDDQSEKNENDSQTGENPIGQKQQKNEAKTQKHGLIVLCLGYLGIVMVLLYGVSYVYWKQTSVTFLIMDLMIKIEDTFRRLLRRKEGKEGYSPAIYNEEIDDHNTINIGYNAEQGHELFWERNSVEGI